MKYGFTAAAILLSGLISAVRAQDQTVNGNLTVNGSVQTTNGGQIFYRTADQNIGQTIFWRNAAGANLGGIGIAAGNQRPSFTGWVPNDNDMYVFAPGSNAIGFATNAIGRMVIDSSGRVGIGTATPQAQLSIIGSDLFLNWGGGSNGGDLRLGTNSNQAFIGGNQYYNGQARYARNGGSGYINFDVSGAATAGDISFLTAPSGVADGTVTYTERLRVQQSTGDVGIGTPTPGARLHISGPTAVGMILEQTVGAGSLNNQILFKANGYDDWQIGTDVAAGGTTGNFEFYSSQRSGGAGTTFTLAKNGNVGIGTTSPGASLDILGPSGPFGDFIGYSGTTGQGLIWPNGHAPELLIECPNTGACMNPPNDTYRGGIGFGYGVGIYSVNPNPAGSPYYGDIRFHTTWWDGTSYRNSDRMAVTMNGNVGIGTDWPGAKLEIGGAGAIVYLNGADNVATLSFGRSDYSWRISNETDLRIYGGGGRSPSPTTFALTIQNTSGNVGIGTLTPGAKLDVAGSANIQGNLAVGGTFSAPTYTATSGTIIGGTSGLTLSSGGTNQNVTITPSGTGATVLNGSVGIGTPTPQSRLDVAGGIRAQTWFSTFSYDGFSAGVSPSLTLTQPNGVDAVAVSYATTGAGEYPAFMRFYSPDAAGARNTASFIARVQGSTTKLALNNDGSAYFASNVGIGTAQADKTLTVKGTIHATEVVVDTTVAAKDLRVKPAGWADDVFADGHQLEPLAKVEQEIKAERRLPGVPSAKEVAANGVSVGDMQSILLRKIEELTLHVIQIEKENTQLRRRVEQLEGAK